MAASSLSIAIHPTPRDFVVKACSKRTAGILSHMHGSGARKTESCSVNPQEIENDDENELRASTQDDRYSPTPELLQLLTPS
jgi:hypothetical protein